VKVGEERFRPILNKNTLLHSPSNLPPMSATRFATNVRHQIIVLDLSLVLLDAGSVTYDDVVCTLRRVQ